MYNMLNELEPTDGEENKGERKRNKIPITSMRLIRANNLQFSASRHSISDICRAHESKQVFESWEMFVMVHLSGITSAAHEARAEH